MEKKVEAVKETVSTAELIVQTELINELRTEEAFHHAAKKIVTEKLEEAEAQMIELLHQAGLKNFRSDAGLVTITHRSSVRLPQTAEDWALLKAHLAAEGLEDKLVVGSQWLNGYYKSRIELAQEGKLGNPDIPGAGAITISETLSLKKVK